SSTAVPHGECPNRSRSGSWQALLTAPQCQSLLVSLGQDSSALGIDDVMRPASVQHRLSQGVIHVPTIRIKCDDNAVYQKVPIGFFGIGACNSQRLVTRDGWR